MSEPLLEVIAVVDARHLDPHETQAEGEATAPGAGGPTHRWTWPTVAWSLVGVLDGVLLGATG